MIQVTPTTTPASHAEEVTQTYSTHNFPTMRSRTDSESSEEDYYEETETLTHRRIPHPIFQLYERWKERVKQFILHCTVKQALCLCAWVVASLVVDYMIFDYLVALADILAPLNSICITLAFVWYLFIRFDEWLFD